MVCLSKIKFWIPALFLLMALTACSSADAPISFEDIVGTNVAGTLTALPTMTPWPTTTSLPRTRNTPTPYFSATPISSLTPIPTLTFTPTPTATITPIPPGGREIGRVQGRGNYFCKLVDQQPGDWVTMKPGDVVYAYWMIQNVGSKNWPKGGIDIFQVEGRKLHIGKSEFTNSAPVDVGLTMNVIIPMQAPKEEGEYQTTWALRRDTQVFCFFVFGMIVKEPTPTPTNTATPTGQVAP